jgi:hypothetical protein
VLFKLINVGKLLSRSCVIGGRWSVWGFDLGFWRLLSPFKALRPVGSLACVGDALTPALTLVLKHTRIYLTVVLQL